MGSQLKGAHLRLAIMIDLLHEAVMKVAVMRVARTRLPSAAR